MGCSVRLGGWTVEEEMEAVRGVVDGVSGVVRKEG